MSFLNTVSRLTGIVSTAALISLPAFAEPPSQWSGATTPSAGGPVIFPSQTSASLLGDPLSATSPANQEAQNLAKPNFERRLNLQPLRPPQFQPPAAVDSYFNEQPDTPDRVYLLDESRP